MSPSIAAIVIICNIVIAIAAACWVYQYLHRRARQTEELRRLKAELKRVTEERDILKKAAAYFAKQSG